MEAGTFKDLIVEAYKKSKEGILVGTLYGAISTSSFSDIPDIEEFLKVGLTDMLHLQSTVTGMEEDIYERTLENYKVKASERTIYIKLKDKPEQPFMY